jgi:hypothetical protein
VGSSALPKHTCLNRRQGMSKKYVSADSLPRPVPHPKCKHFVDRTGQRYGRLTVLYHAGKYGRGKTPLTHWLCVRDCGVHIIVGGGDLQQGKTRSCGCLLRQHGMGTTPEYAAWRQLVSRCTNPANKAYARYGGRGISVCQRWLDSVEAFVQDMGRRPTEWAALRKLDVSAIRRRLRAGWTVERALTTPSVRAKERAARRR